VLLRFGYCTLVAFELAKTPFALERVIDQGGINHWSPAQNMRLLSFQDENAQTIHSTRSAVGRRAARPARPPPRHICVVAYVCRDI
jgi:hypothetical protein